MFRKRTAEILRRGLKLLNELNTAKEAERLLVVPIEPLVKNENSLPNSPSEPGSYNIIDLAVVEALSANFDPSDPF